MTILNDLVEIVERELDEENIQLAKEILKERLVEIKKARRILAKMEKQFKELLERDIDDIIFQ